MASPLSKLTVEEELSEALPAVDKIMMFPPVISPISLASNSLASPFPLTVIFTFDVICVAPSVSVSSFESVSSLDPSSFGSVSSLDSSSLFESASSLDSSSLFKSASSVDSLSFFESVSSLDSSSGFKSAFSLDSVSFFESVSSLDSLSVFESASSSGSVSVFCFCPPFSDTCAVPSVSVTVILRVTT